MKHKSLLLYSWFIRTVLFFFPDIPVVMRFRGFLYGLGMKRCGKNFQVTHDAIIREIENITVGNNCFIGNSVIIMGSGKIIIEDKVLIGPHAIIVSGNHQSDGNSYRAGFTYGTVKICFGSWVAGNSTIQKDSILPPNSVLSANSFLNKKFDTSNSVYGGVPAKFIRIVSYNNIICD